MNRPYSRLTVLHAAHTGEGGVGKCVGDFAGDQVARDWRVVVATDPDSRLAREAADAGAEVVPWHATRHPTWRVAAETRRLRQIIGSSCPDVLHLHTSKAGLCGRIAVRGRRPTIFHPHCWSFEAVGGPQAKLATVWERFAARWAHTVVCVSEAERAQGIAVGIEARYRVIPNGVDLTRFPGGNDENQRAARERLGLSDGPLVVCVGRLSRQKGQDVLVEAWKLVRRLVPDAELMLVGEGDDLEMLRARSDDSIRFTGQRADVVDWLTACDVVALPSRWEGMSLGMLEAMAAGRSLVVTDVHGAREAVEGVGAIVPPEDVEGLAEALGERLLDPTKRQEEGAAAAGRAREKFDIRRTFGSIADLYAEITALHRPV